MEILEKKDFSRNSHLIALPPLILLLKQVQTTWLELGVEPTDYLFLLQIVQTIMVHTTFRKAYTTYDFECSDGNPLPIYGKGNQIRDWLYVEDHAKAL